MSKKIAYVGAAPAYYFIPFLQKLHNESGVELNVFWGSKESTKRYVEKQFGAEVDESQGLLDGYKYHFLNNYIGKETYQKGFWHLNSFELYKIFRKDKYDFVIVHGWQYLNNINAIIAAKLNGTKVLIRAETPLNQELRKTKTKLAFRKLLLRVLFGLADGFLYIGQENKFFYKYYGVPESKLFYTPYSVNNEKFQTYICSNIDKKKDLRHSLGINNNDVVVTFVGKIFHKKRPLTLLKAFEKLNDPKAKLLYVGSGEQESMLKQYIVERKIGGVIFAGYQSQDNLPDYLNISDVFVLPSGDGETWGLVSNEAMNFSLPIVTSNIVGSHLDVATEKNGYSFELDNVDELANCLYELVNDHDLRKKLGEGSLAIVEGLTTENVKNGILKAINALQ